MIYYLKIMDINYIIIIEYLKIMIQIHHQHKKKMKKIINYIMAMIIILILAIIKNFIMNQLLINIKLLIVIF